MAKPSTLRYYEIRTFEPEMPRFWDHQIMTCANVPRGVLTIDHENGDNTGFVRRNATFWLRESTSSSGWDGEFYYTC